VDLFDDARAMSDDLVRLRQELHRDPEVGLDLPRTQEKVLRELDGLGLEISTGTGTTSVTAVLRGGARDEADPRTVLLRADMDALPVAEETGLDFASTNGAMHACGHDLHTASLIGGARLLAQHRDQLRGDVVLMFQPGEEGWDGAGVMLEEGVLTAAGPQVGAAYGMHVRSGKTPNGVFSTRGQTMMSSSGRLVVTVQGRGGHGSSPHLGRDPISAAAEMITTLQTMVTRRFDVFDPVVITVGTVSGGTAANIIPDTAEFSATVRTFSAATGGVIGAVAAEVCRGVASAHGLSVDVRYVPEYPATVNDPAEAAFQADTVGDLFGPESYLPMDYPEPGSEDFSRVLQAVPGSYVMLGASVDEDYAASPSNHSPLARFDDAVMPRGALLHAELALRSLARLAGTTPSPSSLPA
jgi:amidohydrolase